MFLSYYFYFIYFILAGRPGVAREKKDAEKRIQNLIYF